MPSPKKTFTRIAVCTCKLPGCDQEFLRVSLPQTGHQKYCSVACSKAAKRLQSVRHAKDIKAEVKEGRGGMVRCLGRCGEMFMSWDVRLNRICPSCTSENRDISRSHIVLSMWEQV